MPELILLGLPLVLTHHIPNIVFDIPIGADDLPELPGTLHASALTSRHASAEILSIDTSEAESLAGVAAVITAKDVPNNCLGLKVQDEYVFADKRTHYEGEAIAAVAAETPEIAKEAVDKIQVEYRPLEPVFDPREAMKADAPRVHPEKDNLVFHFKLRRGEQTKPYKEIRLTKYEYDLAEKLIERQVRYGRMIMDGVMV